jgi:hypothetical protein
MRLKITRRSIRYAERSKETLSLPAAERCATIITTHLGSRGIPLLSDPNHDSLYFDPAWPNLEYIQNAVVASQQPTSKSATSSS